MTEPSAPPAHPDMDASAPADASAEGVAAATSAARSAATATAAAIASDAPAPGDDAPPPEAPPERRYGLRDLLEPSDLRRLWRLMFLILIAGIFETVTVASLLPFLGAIVDAESVKASGHLSWAYDALGFTSRRDFVIALGFASLTLLLVGNTLQALVRWRTSCFTADVNERLSRRLLSTYLHAPYEFHLSRNATDLARSVLDEVQHVTNDYIFPLLFLISRAALVLLLITMLIVVDPWMALLAGVTLGGAYALTLRILKARIHRAGRIRVEANEARYKSASEALAAIREVKLYEREEGHLDRFSAHTKRYARAQVTQDAIGQLPKSAIEVIAFGSVIVLALVALGSSRTPGATITLLGLFAFAGYRLVPALQGCYQSLTAVRFRRTAVQNLCRELLTTPVEATSPKDAAPVPLARHSIGLRGITFRYPTRRDPVLKDFSIEIPVGSSLAIVGPTGSGKSTALDLLFGLLRPQEGAIVVDGVPLTAEQIPAWRKQVAYVSQYPVLIDATVRANIAFGVPPAEVDEARVRQCAQRASIARFIEHELPDRYDTIVGDKGVRLSGGQRQRIAIARALYAGRAILGLDEASSALDEATERDVMSGLLGKATELTVVLITHRKGVGCLATAKVDLTRSTVAVIGSRGPCRSAPL